jgi:DNA repair photolyase
VRTAGYVMLRLPLEVKDLFREWLHAEVPDRASRVMSLVRATRGGKDYDAKWQERGRGTGPIAEAAAGRFQLACKRLGLNLARRTLDTSKFSPPPKATNQLNLF